MPKEYDLLVAGEINPDLILSDPNLLPRFGQQEILVSDANLTIGSSSAIFACGAARLGLKVALIGVVGRDFFGKYMLEALAGRGVDVSCAIVDPDQKTGLSVILNRGTDRAILTHIGAMDALRAEQVSDALLAKGRHLHVASYFLQTELQPGLPDLFHRARAFGLSTSLDTNWDPSGRWEGVAEVLRATSVFLPNQAEALALTQTTTAERALQMLVETVPVVAVKLGKSGAIADSRGETARVHAPLVEVVDTVGAGDSFNAGFIFGYLQGWSLEASLHLAVTCGSLSTRASGGTAAQPGLEEAMQWRDGRSVA